MAAEISKETMCNRALSLIKVDATINNLILDVTPQAKLCRAFFDESLDAVLEMHPWNFAEYEALLTRDPVSPLFGYDYRHYLPVDPYCLVVLEVVDADAEEVLNWRISQNRTLESDTADLMIKYTGRITNYTTSSVLFRECFGFYLASKLAEPLLHSSDVVARMEKGMYKMLRKAQRVDSQQGTYEPETVDDYSWLVAKNS